MPLKIECCFLLLNSKVNYVRRGKVRLGLVKITSVVKSNIFRALDVVDKYTK